MLCCVEVGQFSQVYCLCRTEELYHVMAGHGLLTFGEAQFQVNTGDTICINPSTQHRITNTGGEPLRIVCPLPSQPDSQLANSFM